MFAEERREKIIALLQKKRRVFVKDLAEQFHISIDSVRRDLAMMEQNGLLQRTHGGAIPAVKGRFKPLTPSQPVKNPFSSSGEIQLYAADARSLSLAELAVSHIAEGNVVFLGGDPVHLAMLDYLPADLSFTAVTNSIPVADALKHFPRIETYMICGRISSDGTIYDSFSVEFVKAIKIDVNFLGGCGLSVQYGLSASTPAEAAFYKTVMEISRKTICLTNAEHFGNDRFARIMPISEVSLIITDSGASPGEIEEIRHLGTEVIVVPDVTNPTVDGVFLG